MAVYEGPLSRITLLTATITVGSGVTYTNSSSTLDALVGKVEIPIFYAKATTAGAGALTGTMTITYMERTADIPYLSGYAKTAVIPSFTLVNGINWGLIPVSSMYDHMMVSSVLNGTTGSMVTLEVGVTGVERSITR